MKAMVYISNKQRTVLLRHDYKWQSLPLKTDGNDDDGVALVCFLNRPDAETFCAFLRHNHNCDCEPMASGDVYVGTETEQ